MFKVIVIDCETSGLPADSRRGHPDARVIEVAAAVLDFQSQSPLIYEWSSLVRPTRPLGPWAKPALELTGIREEELAVALHVASVGEQLRTILRQYSDNKPTYLAGWNHWDFDLHPQFLGADCWLGGSIGAHFKTLDVAEVYRHHMGLDKYTQGWSLKAACAYYGWQPPGHRALADAKATGRVLWKLWKNGALKAWEAAQVPVADAP